MQHYFNRRDEKDPHRLPSLETFKKEGKYYWRSCFPGCLPDSDDFGPFDTLKEALEDAREGME